MPVRAFGWLDIPTTALAAVHGAHHTLEKLIVAVHDAVVEFTDCMKGGSGALARAREIALVTIDAGDRTGACIARWAAVPRRFAACRTLWRWWA